jgi:hypothetical protein
MHLSILQAPPESVKTIVGIFLQYKSIRWIINNIHDILDTFDGQVSMVPKNVECC